MGVVDEMWEDPEFSDFINNPDVKLKQLVSAFNYLKYVGFSDDDIVKAVRVMLARIPSDRLVDYSEGDSDE